MKLVGFPVFVLNQETVEMAGSPSQHQSHPLRFIIQPANRLRAWFVESMFALC